VPNQPQSFDKGSRAAAIAAEQRTHGGEIRDALEWAGPDEALF